MHRFQSDRRQFPNKDEGFSDPYKTAHLLILCECARSVSFHYCCAAKGTTSLICLRASVGGGGFLDSRLAILRADDLVALKHSLALPAEQLAGRKGSDASPRSSFARRCPAKIVSGPHFSTSMVCASHLDGFSVGVFSAVPSDELQLSPSYNEPSPHLKGGQRPHAWTRRSPSRGMRLLLL